MFICFPTYGSNRVIRNAAVIAKNICHHTMLTPQFVGSALLNSRVRQSLLCRGKLFYEPSSPSFFLRAASLFCEPRKITAEKSKKGHNALLWSLFIHSERWHCNMFNCEPKSFCRYLLVKHPSVNNIHVYSRGDVLLLSVQNSAPFVLHVGKIHLEGQLYRH